MDDLPEVSEDVARLNPSVFPASASQKGMTTRGKGIVPERGGEKASYWASRLPERASGEKPMTEKMLESIVAKEAKRTGWLRYHTWRATHSPAGFPDDTLVRGPRLVFMELKREGEKPTEVQQQWLDTLDATNRVEVYVIRPSDVEDGTLAKILE